MAGLGNSSQVGSKPVTMKPKTNTGVPKAGGMIGSSKPSK